MKIFALRIYNLISKNFSCCKYSQQVDGSGNTCPLDPYVIVSDKSDYIDQQTMKLQEAPEDCPTGEMPRSILLAAER